MIRKPVLFAQVLLAVAILNSAIFAQSSQTASGCGPSPEVRTALKQLPDYWREPALTNWQVYQQRTAKLDVLMRQYPNNVFVQRTYIESATFLRSLSKASVERRAKIDAQYKALHEQQPDDPHVDFLYGLTLMGHDTPQAITLFESALAKDPRFVLPHEYLGRIYASPVFDDKGKSLDHLEGFLDACPATIEGYRAVSAMISDKEQLAKYAGKLRAVLEQRSDGDIENGYPILWAMEFKTHPASEYSALGKKVASDLERLRKLNLQNDPDWYGALENGYRLANDQKQADWAKEESEKRFPVVGQLPDKVKWHKDHPGPEGDVPAAARLAYYRDVLAESDKWLKEPAASALVTFHILEDRVDAMSHLDDVPADEVVKSVEQMLRFGAENGGPGPWSDDFSPWSSDYRHAANVLSKKHIAPERVVDYAQKGLAITEVEIKEPMPDLWATKDNLAGYNFWQAQSRLEMLKYEIGGYLELKQADKASPLLAGMDRRIQDLKSLAADKDDRMQDCSRWLADYWGMRAREAEVRGRNLDAAAFYQNALLVRLDAKIKPPADEKDELAENAHRLWISLNGTEEGWQLWYGHRANDLANDSGFRWEKANEPLPAFELADLNDTKWNVNSLKGKTTLISFWATWCGPCRQELPHLQKLMEINKDRSDIQFITLNMDDNPGLIQPFLEEQKLAMVVIPATTYISETLKVNAIPTSWIVDTQATVRKKTVGYDSSEKWVSGMQSAIEEVKSGGTPASPGVAPQ